VLEALANALPLILAGAFMPTWIIVTAGLLLTDRPLANSLSFVAGNFAWRLLTGLAALFAFEVQAFTLAALPRPWALGVTAATAALTAALAVVEWTRRGRPGDNAGRWLERFKRLRPWQVFALSAAIMTSPGIQWVYLLGGVAVIRSSGLGPALEVATLVVFCLLQVSLLLVPVAIYASQPARAHEALGRFERWLIVNAHAFTAGVLALVTVLLAVRLWLIAR